MPYQAVIAGIGAAVDAGATDPGVVAVEARRHRDGQRTAPILAATGTDNPIPENAWSRPAPNLTVYDTLLNQNEGEPQ
jgi:hypothetical protein